LLAGTGLRLSFLAARALKPVANDAVDDARLGTRSVFTCRMSCLTEIHVHWNVWRGPEVGRHLPVGCEGEPREDVTARPGLGHGAENAAMGSILSFRPLKSSPPTARAGNRFLFVMH
jgi:hypothetical protein